MRRWLGVAARGLGLVGAASALTLVGGAVLWRRRSAELVRVITGDDSTVPPGPISMEELRDVPPSVRRYFAAALTPSQQRIRGAVLIQSGVLRGDGNERWRRFRAVEHVSVEPPGFVWDASVGWAPFAVHVRDAYAARTGSSSASFAALVPLGEAKRSPEVASASLIRYLAEAAWFPTALLPSCGVEWTQSGEGAARATLRDGTITASVDIAFGDDGMIASVSASRYRSVAGRMVLTPWRGRMGITRRSRACGYRVGRRSHGS